jgi:hypothetical protein
MTALDPRAILREFGFTAGEIDGLSEAGVIKPPQEQKD